MRKRYDQADDKELAHAIEVRPSFVAKARQIEEWSANGKEGRRAFDDALNLAVTEIVEKYRIVEAVSATKLRRWIGECDYDYFSRKNRDTMRVTEAQARDRWVRIEAAAETLLKEIPLHLGLRLDLNKNSPLRDPFWIGSSRVDEHLTQLKEILEYTKRTHERHYNLCKYKGNAAKPALAWLGYKIRLSWISAWVSVDAMDHDTADALCRGTWMAQVPVIAAGSKYDALQAN